MIKVSVIIPVYNAEKFLERCLTSLCNQTLKDIEIICVDDCSQDNSVNIVKEFMAKDERVHLISHTENGGSSKARNTGIKHSTGEYLGFVDADDYPDLDFYEKLYTVAQKTHSDLIKGNLRTFYGNSSIVDQQLEKIKKSKVYLLPGFFTAIYNKEFFIKEDLFFVEEALGFEDMLFNANVIQKVKTIDIVENAFYNYFLHNQSKRHNNCLAITKSRVQSFKSILLKFKDKEDCSLVLNEYLLPILFSKYSTIQEEDSKLAMKQGIIELLTIYPDLEIEKDFDVLYKRHKIKMLKKVSSAIRNK